MLETLNDYISLAVMIFMALAGIRLFIGALRYGDIFEVKKKSGILFGYSDNEDE